MLPTNFITSTLIVIFLSFFNLTGLLVGWMFFFGAAAYFNLSTNVVLIDGAIFTLLWMLLLNWRREKKKQNQALMRINKS